MRPHLALALIAAFESSLMAWACDNQPAAGKPSASVQDIKAAPELAGPPVPPIPPSPVLGTTAYGFSQDDSQLEFVGAKLTGKHHGSFKTFQGTIHTREGAVAGGSVSVEIDVDSLEADVPKLTAHLKSPDLLDSARYPKARFSSTAITAKADEAQYTVTGSFELHGVTKLIGFPATIRVQPGSVEAEAEFAINRKDFGIVYPGKPDDLIQDDVLIKLKIRAASLGLATGR